ncbi:MAG: hypothetical protein RI967_140 [Planctomycetota bacterium]
MIASHDAGTPRNTGAPRHACDAMRASLHAASAPTIRAECDRSARRPRDGARSRAADPATRRAFLQRSVAGRAQGGFVLVAVIVVVAAAVLVATGAIFTARAATAGSRASGESERLRGAALDGVRLAAERLAASRDAILAGGEPELEARLLERGEGGARLEVRLAAMPAGGFAESESAKIDLGHPDGARIARERLDDLVAARADLPTEFPEALLAARADEGLDGCLGRLPADLRPASFAALFGALRTLDEEEETRAAAEARAADPGARAGASGAAAGASEAGALPLLSILTVHAQEPLVRADGAPRLDLVAALGEGADETASGASLADFAEAELAAMREAAAKAGAMPDDGALAAALLARGVAPARIAEILDLATLHPGRRAPARLDILRAGREALASLEVGGEAVFGAEGAERLLDLRESLAEDERRSTAWLVDRRVLDAERYARVAGSLSARSTVWRVRVVARPAPDEDALDAGSVASAARAAFDAVIDVGGEAPRIVFLRDVSMLATARVLARAEALRAEATRDDLARFDAVASEPATVDDAAGMAPPTIGGAIDLEIPSRSATLGAPRVSAPPPRPDRRSVVERGRDVPG